jgi:hypothetical protein
MTDPKIAETLVDELEWHPDGDNLVALNWDCGGDSYYRIQPDGVPYITVMESREPLRLLKLALWFIQGTGAKAAKVVTSYDLEQLKRAAHEHNNKERRAARWSRYILENDPPSRVPVICA